MEKPLFWHQGLFIQPQHLQLKDMFDKSLTIPYHTHIKPHLSGVVQMDIALSSISLQSFAIQQGTFWFPDMTYAVIGKNAMMAPRSFSGLWTDNSKPLMVYLGLKRFDPLSKNVTEIEQGEDLDTVHTRFISYKTPEEVSDLYLGGSQAQVRRMDYVLKVFFGGETDKSGAYDLIPVAMIERSGQQIQLSQEFVHPCVTCAASDILSGMIREFGNRLAFRGGELEALKNRRGIHSSDFGSRDMVYLLALRSFNRYIPYFHTISDNPAVHPHDVYTVIRQLVGELSAFSESVNVLGIDSDGKALLPPYDHAAPRDCFASALSLISRLIDEITAGPEYVVALPADDLCFTSAMKPEYFQGSNHYFLVMRTEAELKSVIDAVDINVKIGSRSMLPSMIERSLPGVRVEYLPVNPQELPRYKNAVYFKIDVHSEHWSQVERDKTLALYWDSAPEDMKIELMIVRRR